MTTLNEFGFSIFGILDEFGRFVGTPSILDERAHRIFITVFTVTVADEIVNSAVTVSESKTEIFDSSESTDIYVSRPNFIRSDFATTSTLIQSLVKEVVPDHIKEGHRLTETTYVESNIRYQCLIRYLEDISSIARRLYICVGINVNH